MFVQSSIIIIRASILTDKQLLMEDMGTSRGIYPFIPALFSVHCIQANWLNKLHVEWTLPHQYLQISSALMKTTLSFETTVHAERSNAII